MIFRTCSSLEMGTRIVFVGSFGLRPAPFRLPPCFGCLGGLEVSTVFKGLIYFSLFVLV